MHNTATITWNEKEGRYELHIGGKLKAYTQHDHKQGAAEMERMAREKGYEVVYK
ncbi:hypothetical protein GBK2_58 [Geobacillus phage GBK2]|uniref:hypothetical protein n=1 Tax=Geobacillus phage GBK2 TaxID=1458842 RepID=UPI0003F20447|nr:hypothetical protein GBK2_58 [Geobacillus phage GBK2]AHJ88656.1 hypothetical protein GBK2_58 [Geobacillus phage GBK2]